MTFGDDPLNPAVDPGIAPQAADPGALAGEWREWMAEPGNRQAIMQFGIQLMQPVAYGQSPAGHFGQAVGAAGEAVDRFQTAEMREREQQRKEVDTEQRGEIGMYRAETQAQRLKIDQLNADTRRLGTLSRIEVGEARIRELNEKALRLQRERDSAIDPATKRQLDEELSRTKIESMRTQSALRQEQKDAIMPGLGIRQQQANTATERATTAREQGERRLQQGDERLDIMRMGAEDRRRHWATMDENKKQELYETAKLLGGKGVPSRAQWEAENFGTRAGPPAGGPAQPAPPAAGATPVGQTKNFRQGTFEKIAPGPDSDQSTWQKVD